MFDLVVRDHCMIAHSFKGEIFGPAQQMHGATYVVDASFQRPELDPDGLVVDIGLATQALKDVLAEINYKNLDALDIFKGVNTTTEFLAYWIHGRMAAKIAEGGLGQHATGLTDLTITLGESHVAWARYSGPLAAGGR